MTVSTRAPTLRPSKAILQTRRLLQPRRRCSQAYKQGAAPKAQKRKVTMPIRRRYCSQTVS
eukprot:7673111-Prorocentrum_lima.AAC.1